MRIGCILLLCYLSVLGQLDHFQFSFPAGMNQTAGDSFPVDIVAIDASGDTWNTSFQANLSTTRGAQYINPTLAYFINGVWNGYPIITLADTLRMICSFSTIIDTSTRLTIDPNSTTHIILLTPGETHTPGIKPGKFGSPGSHYAGENFDATVYLTDDWFNPVGTGSDSIYFSSTDQFGYLPGGRLTNGGGVFTLHFRTSGAQDLYGYDYNTQIVGDTSSPIMVFSENYTRLLVLLPGETHLPGDTTTDIFNTPGKSGNPNPQYVGEAFPVNVYSCDSFWNLNTSTNNYQIDLFSNFPFNSYPSIALLQNGIAHFDSVIYDSAGENQDMWAQDINNYITSYLNRINIYARARFISAVADSDTMSAGHITEVHATVMDINQNPLWNKLVQFEVSSGNGVMLDTTDFTDSLGVATVRFFASSPFFDETDTIRVTSDTAVAFVDIYIQVPESLVTQGEVVAYPNPLRTQDRKVTLLYYLPSACNVKILVYDTFGNPVRKWELAPNDEGSRLGLNRFEWDGKDQKRRRVASGAYIVQIIGYSHTENFFNRTAKVGVVW